MSSIWGNKLKLSLFGESHGAAIGFVLDGLPAGESIDEEAVARALERRSPKNKTATKRCEDDKLEILSGVFNGKTTGTPLAAVIFNKDTISSDYNRDILRPSHADYAGFVRYNGYNDYRGGGHFSGRLTAPLVAAGAICSEILKRRGINIGAHILSIGNIFDDAFNPVCIENSQIDGLKSGFPVLNGEAESLMKLAVENISGKDSLGGIIECAITGIPAGVGNPIFGAVESVIASLAFAVPAVKGVEFGAGFAISELRGSEANDAIYINKGGEIYTKTNNNGGITGGITNGMPIIWRAAFKPTPSIPIEQDTVNIKSAQNVTYSVSGRHDPCIVLRAVPCIEAVSAIALAELLF